MLTKQELDVRFTYHPPTADQTMRYDDLRTYFRRLAMTINMLVPESRESELALQHLEQAHFYTNAAIARRE